MLSGQFRVYKFRLFISLDGSECSVFVGQSPYQLIVQQSYREIKFLTRRKEGKKERKKKEKQFCVFDLERF